MRFSKQKTNYQSEITLFLEELKKTNPHLEQDQRAGRALLWDKAPLSSAEQDRIFNSPIPLGSH
jgi:hypothetical protein